VRGNLCNIIFGAFKGVPTRERLKTTDVMEALVYVAEGLCSIPKPVSHHVVLGGTVGYLLPVMLTIVRS